MAQIKGQTSGAWIETFTGRRFPMLGPCAEDICIEDIAHALSLLARFTGHTREFYSVAEHSVRVSWLCDTDDAPWGLLHDASEAYLGDMSRPLKHCTEIGAHYREIESRVMAAICERFGLSGEMPESVHRADCALLLAEKRDLMTATTWDDLAKWEIRCGSTRHDARIDPMPARYAEGLFMSRFRQLFPSYV